MCIRDSYDSGLFFDEATGRRFVVAGYNEISVTELDENFNACLLYTSLRHWLMDKVT